MTLNGAAGSWVHLAAEPRSDRSVSTGVFYCLEPSRPRTMSSIPTSNPDPTDPDQRHGTMVPDPTDPDPTDPDPDFRPCSANPRPWTPSNRYRLVDERAATRKKLTPPD